MVRYGLLPLGLPAYYANTAWSEWLPIERQVTGTHLRLVPRPAGAALSWPASTTDYVVQVADRLDSLNWQPAPGTPSRKAPGTP